MFSSNEHKIDKRAAATADDEDENDDDDDDDKDLFCIDYD